MTQRIFGLIGVLWGGGVLINLFVTGGPQGSGAFAAGQYGGLAFAGVMLVVGMFALIRGNGPKKE